MLLQQNFGFAPVPRQSIYHTPNWFVGRGKKRFENSIVNERGRYYFKTLCHERKKEKHNYCLTYGCLLMVNSHFFHTNVIRACFLSFSLDCKTETNSDKKKQEIS